MNLRVYPKNKKHVIQDMDNKRKQVGKPYPSKTAANVALKKLIGDIATGKVVVGDRYKFKDEFKRFGELKLRQADDPSVRLSKEGVRAYDGFYRNYIEPYFPDSYEVVDPKGKTIKKSCIYLDEINGQALEKFIITIYTEKKCKDKDL